MTLVSSGAKKVAKTVCTALSIAGTVAGSAMQEQGKTVQNKQLETNGTLIEFIGSQLDVSCNLVEAGLQDARKVTTQEVANALTQKALAFGDFAPQEAIQCGAALASLGVTAFTTFFPAAETAGLSLYFMGANLLAETYAAKVDCSTVMDSTFKDVNNGLNSFAARLDYEVKAWIESAQPSVIPVSY